MEIKIFIYYVGLDFGNKDDFDSLPDLSQNSFLEMKSSEETSFGLRHQIMLDARKANGSRKGRSDGGKVAKGCKETSNGGKTGKEEKKSVTQERPEEEEKKVLMEGRLETEGKLSLTETRSERAIQEGQSMAMLMYQVCF